MRALLAAVNCQKNDLAANFATHQAVADEAASEGCNIVVFPEMSLTGYLDPRREDHEPVSIDSEQVAEAVMLSRDRDLAVLFGIVEGNPVGLPYITQVLAAEGEIKAVYRKRHLGEGEPGLFGPGAESVVGEVSDERFGIAICADRDWPDEFSFAAESGARVVFHPSAPGLWGRRTDEASWKSGFDWWRDTCIEIHGARARELGISIGVATQAGTTEDEDFPGWAALIGPDGEVKSELPDWNAGTLVIEV